MTPYSVVTYHYITASRGLCVLSQAPLRHRDAHTSSSARTGPPAHVPIHALYDINDPNTFSLTLPVRALRY